MAQVLIQAVLVLAQALLLLLLAPLVAGFVNQLTLIWRERTGRRLFSWYYCLRQEARWLAAGRARSGRGPVLYFLAVFLAATLLPNFLGQGLSYGDVFTLTMFLLLGRLARWYSVKVATSTNQAASGSIRELFWAGLSLPVWLLAVLAVVSRSGSTMPVNMLFKFEGIYFSLSNILAALAFFGMTLALNGPVLEPLLPGAAEAEAAVPEGYQAVVGLPQRPLVSYPASGLLLVTLADLLQLLVYLLFFVELFLPLPGFLILRLILAAGVLGAAAAYQGRCRALRPASLLVDSALLLMAALLVQ